MPGETICESNDDKFSSAIGVIVKGQALIGKDYVGWDAVPEDSQDLCYARLVVSKLISLSLHLWLLYC